MSDALPLMFCGEAVGRFSMYARARRNFGVAFWGEAALLLYTSILILPDSPITDIADWIDRRLHYVFWSSSISVVAQITLFTLVFTAVLEYYFIFRNTLSCTAGIRSFADIWCLVAMVMAFNMRCSERQGDNITPILVGLSLPLVFLGCGSAVKARRVTYGIIVLSGIQFGYAVVYYLLRRHQFLTPNFGPRSAGTFDNPNELYPLCLLVVPVAIAICCQRSFWRCVGGGVAILGMLALLLTFTRAGWIGFACSLVLLVKSRPFQTRLNYQSRVILVAVAFFFVIGALFVRTSGRPMGNSTDRSTLGRLAIWKSAANAIPSTPLLGFGIGRFRDVQTRYESQILIGYNPSNTEAKCLFLNLFIETGVIGISLLLGAGYRFVHLCSIVNRDKPDSNGMTLISAITCALAGLLVAGIGDTPILASGRDPSTVVTAILIGTCCAIAVSSSAQTM